jgi:hypothetical protein
MVGFGLKAEGYVAIAPMFERTLVSKIGTLDKWFRNIQLHFRKQQTAPVMKIDAEI